MLSDFRMGLEFLQGFRVQEFRMEFRVQEFRMSLECLQGLGKKGRPLLPGDSHSGLKGFGGVYKRLLGKLGSLYLYDKDPSSHYSQSRRTR